jgi:hypothetical protein
MWVLGCSENCSRDSALSLTPPRSGAPTTEFKTNLAAPATATVV